MANPTILAAVVDTDASTIALTGDSKTLIRYYSDAKAVMEAVIPEAGASINEDMCIITCGNKRGYGREHAFVNVESNTFSFSVEDSNGNIGHATVTAPMVNYVKLTCHATNSMPDGDGNMTAQCTGSYFNGSFGAVSNTLTVQYRYREATSNTWSAWRTMSITTLGSSYAATASLTGLNYQSAYVFEYMATDKLATVNSASSVKSKPVFHWGENDFKFEVPVSFEGDITGSDIGGELSVNSKLRMNGKGIYLGSKDDEYVTSIGGEDGYLFINGHQTQINSTNLLLNGTQQIALNSNNIYLNGKTLPDMQSGIWFPYFCNSNAVSSYIVRQGWYNKIGQSVTIGFYIKATCYSGYQTSMIEIYGLPFTPLYQAVGGGLLSGAYVAASMNFQCFAVETGGYITTRVQYCGSGLQNQNLSTSASGCYFPNGGGQLTVGGTIVYMTTN